MLANIRDMLIIVMLASLMMHGLHITTSATLIDDSKTKIEKIKN